MKNQKKLNHEKPDRLPRRRLTPCANMRKAGVLNRSLLDSMSTSPLATGSIRVEIK